MQIPSTIYIAIGAVIAALITGGISFVNLIISKDQKVSEFRQNWIDELRKDVSEFIGYTSRYSALLLSITEQSNEHDLIIKETRKLFKKDVHQTATLFNRIVLRLNPVDDKKILDKLSEIEQCYDNSITELANADKISTLTAELRESVQELLKKEWKRVKRGELTYRITKYSVLALFLTTVGIIIIYHNELLKLFYN